MEMILYFGTLVLGGIIVAYSQLNISSNYSKYKKVKLAKNMSGQEIARMILDANGLNDIYVVETKGNLTDHYDPRRKVVRLSTSIYHGETIAAASVAAHEVGHAIQDKDGYTFMRIRSALVPFVNFVSYLGYLGLLISLFAGITGYLKLIILVILATILFQLVTLPVEFDASARAKKQLLSLNLINSDEHKGTEKMLNAAALTYVASLFSNLLQLLRLVLILGNRSDD